MILTFYENYSNTTLPGGFVSFARRSYRNFSNVIMSQKVFAKASDLLLDIFTKLTFDGLKAGLKVGTLDL
jgi:hypothetical protein